MFNRINGTALAPFGHGLDSIFGELFDAPSARSAHLPPVSVWEDSDSFHLEVEVPGVAAEDLDISVVGKRVTFKGERAEVERGEAKLHRRERSALKFERSFELPIAVDGQKVEADLSQGILKVTLPKAAEHKPRRIKVTSQDA